VTSAARAIDPAALAARLDGILPIGRGPAGTTRLAWTAEDAAACDWFREQAAAAGLRAERDPAGNLWAVPGVPPPWWALGSHLDTVREGGSYDGALGVACALEVAARSEAPVAVISFADEEGARFNTPTFGSRALCGTLDTAVLERADGEGMRLADAMAAVGIDPVGLPAAPEWLARLRGFLELHVDQTPDLARAERPAGVVRGLVARLRLRADLEGRAGHTGTTPPAERRDALAAAARLIVAAHDAAKQPPQAGHADTAEPAHPGLADAAEPAHPGLVVTAPRIEVEPNALTTIAARASVWLDARAPDPGEIAAWRARLERSAGGLGAGVSLSVESQSPPSEFDPGLRARLLALADRLGEPAPELDCYAGHDAGILSARLPAAMVLVRNPAGISHSPDEEVDLADAAFAAELLLRLVEELHR
jgi:beta-ureidopropionase / N-carbamoyl-L-amino-acid hydrolase